MTHSDARTDTAQLTMPGMPPVVTGTGARRDNVAPGQQVLYLGNVAGGPRYGTRGVVTQLLGRKAIVDIRGAGVWHVPYFFLGLPAVGG